MSPQDRAIAERVHEIVKGRRPGPHAEDLVRDARLCQGRQGRLLLPNAGKFKERYAMFGFNDTAKLDEGSMWPVAFALEKLTAADEKKIAALVKKAVKLRTGYENGLVRNAPGDLLISPRGRHSVRWPFRPGMRPTWTVGACCSLDDRGWTFRAHRRGGVPKCSRTLGNDVGRRNRGNGPHSRRPGRAGRGFLAGGRRARSLGVSQRRLRQHGVVVDAPDLRRLPHDVVLSERLLRTGWPFGDRRLSLGHAQFVVRPRPRIDGRDRETIDRGRRCFRNAKELT